MRIYLFDGAKLRTIGGTFAKNRALTIEFNTFFDNMLSFSSPFLPKSDIASRCLVLKR